MKWLSLPTLLLCGFVVSFSVAGEALAGNVTYDGRSLVIDGQHRTLFSGSIHYPRSTPEMRPSLIAEAKGGGIDVIQTYVFWNLHETEQGQYDFSGRNDLVGFLKEMTLGKSSCSITASNGKFGDPCPGLLKTLVIDAQCK